MAKIFYSLSGEGRGHSSRARTLIDDLCRHHEITVYAPAHAFEMLAPVYRNAANVRVIRIPGLTFQYNDKMRLDYVFTLVKSADYFFSSPLLVKRLCEDISREKPDLVITDFEPALARAAEKCGVPYVSVDHQHFLLTYDLSSLPPLLRRRAELMGCFMSLFYHKQVKTIVSSFYYPPLRAGVKNVTQVGVFLNEQIRSLQPADEGHLLVYLRRFIDRDLVRTLSALNRRVIVYNKELNEERGNVIFKKISPYTFAEDLASCSCLVSTAGNQLVGEAIYLGKPVFAIPEPDNFEQQINGHFLSASGAGIDYELDQVNEKNLRFFLSNLPMYRARIDNTRMPGNEEVCDIINGMLGVNEAVSVRSRAVS